MALTDDYIVKVSGAPAGGEQVMADAGSIQTTIRADGVAVDTAFVTEKAVRTAVDAGTVADGDKGDVTVSSSGAVWAIDGQAVTYAKMQNISATDKILGRSTAGAGNTEEITCTAAGRALLDDVNAAAQRITMGVQIGVDVQAWSIRLDEIAALDMTVGNMIVSDGTNWTAAASLLATKIEMSELGTATYDDVQDWANQTQSSGVITGGGFTDNGGGTVSVAAGTGFIRATNSATAEVLQFDWPINATLALDVGTNYIYVDYHISTPTIKATTTKTDANNRSAILLGKIYKETDDTLHMVEAGMVITEPAKRTLAYLTTMFGEVARASGIIISEKATQHFELTAGVVFAGLTSKVFDAYDSTATDFNYWYNDGAWQSSATDTISNSQYNNYGVGLANLASQNYGVHWIYSHDDGDTDVVYGIGTYTLSEAEAAQPPANLPPIITDFAFLVGKIIIKRLATVFTEVDSAFKTTFVQEATNLHNELGAIDGGTAGEYFHTTSAQHASVVLQLTAIDAALADATCLTFDADESATFAAGLTVTGEVDATNLDNPNILINTNGADPINQRGIDIVTGEAIATGDFGIDRWSIVETIDVATLKQEDGIRLTATDTTAGAGTIQLKQIIETALSLAGKEVTITASVKSNTNTTRLFFTDGVDSGNDAHTGGGTFETLKIVHTVNAGATIAMSLSLYATGCTDTAPDYIEFKWIKLEVGGVATTWTPPDPAVELGRCQRYYWRMGGQAYTAFGVALYSSNVLARMIVPFPTEMRNVPSFGSSGGFAFAYGDLTGSITSLAIATTISSKVFGSVNVNGTTVANTVAQVQATNDVNAYIEFSAEL